MATREKILNYLNIRDEIEETVDGILNNNVSTDILNDNVPIDTLKNDIIKLTLKVIRQKEEYLKNKLLYEEAINEYAKTKCDAATMIKITQKYGLNWTIFNNEICNRFIPGQTYVYTRIIEEEGFTYAQDESIWQYLKWLIDVDFISCTCRICILLEASIYAYKRSTQWEITLYEYWNLRERASMLWVQKFEMRHRREISSSCSKVILMATREQIQEYLHIKDNIDETVNAILNNTPINTILENTKEIDMIELTLNIVEEKKEYLKNKLLYETAMKDYKKTKHCNKVAACNIVEEYGSHYPTFSREAYISFSKEDYVYTRLKTKEGFTYAQEELLWQFLKWLRDVDFIPCTCRICFLLEASLLAYEYAKQWKIKYHNYWNLCKAATIEWIQMFEMRHRDEISSLCSKQCKIRK